GRGHGPVNPQGHLFTFAGDLVRIPFAGVLAALGFLIIDPDALGFSIDQRIAEEVADILATHLRLMPDRAIRRGADINAAVVAFLALDLLEAPLDMKYAFAELLPVKEHLVNADP